MEQIFTDWHDHTLANTIGLILAESVSEFAGVQTNSIGYSFECGQEIRINVFDNEAEGNDLVNWQIPTSTCQYHSGHCATHGR